MLSLSKFPPVLMLCLCVIALFLSACQDDPRVREKIAAAQARNDGPAILVVTKPEDERAGTLYIYGTIPVVQRETEFWADNLDAALSDVGTVFFQSDNSDEARQAREAYVAQNGYLPEGESLSDELTQFAQGQLLAKALNNDLPPDYFDDHQLWWAAYQAMELGRFELPPGEARFVEGAIQNRLAAQGLRTQYLESPVREYEVFQAWASDVALSVSYDDDRTGQLIEAWRNGNPDAVERALAPSYFTDVTVIDPIFYNLWDAHTDEWTSTLSAFAEQGSSAVVFVDVTYLIGPSALQGKLEERGFKVERYNPNNKGNVISTIELSIDP